jgi:glycosyltransferase involved in cell wall biosynthesis
MNQQFTADIHEQPLKPGTSRQPRVGITLTALSLGRTSINSIAYQGDSSSPSVGVLTTYAPTICGLSSFSASLCDGMEASGAKVQVVRVADGEPSEDPRVVGELTAGSSSSIAACADNLNRCDVAVIQHDVGIYGGTDGADLVEVMRALRVPAIVVAHAVPRNPTPEQRVVFETILDLADQVVVMTDTAGERLQAEYVVHRRKVTTIAHGATIPAAAQVKRGGRPTLLTWGLLRPGKGVERVIESMVALKDLRGQPRYVIAGPTHPRTLAAEGEAYREALKQQVIDCGLTGTVLFAPDYRSRASIAALIQSCAAVVLPYDVTDQVTSGVLVESVANGRPVIATAFPHAVDVLGSGAGIVVAHDRPDALTAALRQVLTDPRSSGAMAAEGRRLAPTMLWPAVSKSYLILAQRLVLERRSMA